MQCRGPWNKSHTLPCLYPELSLTLGVGNLTILSLSPSLTFPNRLSLVWFTWAICVFLASLSAIYQSWPPTFCPPTTQQQFHSFPLSILQQASSSITNLINWFYSSPSSPCPSLSPTIKYPSRWELLCHAGGKLGVVAPTPALHGNIDRSRQVQEREYILKHSLNSH